MISAGEIASEILDSRMVNLEVKRLQVDEIWTYVGKKQRLVTSYDPKEFGDQYVFVALDPDTKLIPMFRVGKRTATLARSFMLDLRSRISTQFQLTTDAFKPYKDEVDYAFGTEIDYAQIHKSYSEVPKGEHRYSPGCIVGIQIIPITGNPVKKHISTSLIERQNLTIRMQMRRFTRLTNAFSKKLESLRAALAIHFFYYNFVRVHQTLRVTPAMEAKLTKHIWTWEELLIRCQQKQAA